MILILTDRGDVHANVLINLLENENIKYFRLNLDTFSLERTKINFENNSWLIHTENHSADLSEVSSIWNRKTFVQLMLDEQDKDYIFNIWKNEWNKTLLGLYYHLKDKKWLNYYRNNHKAENKYLQLDLAKKIGFSIPEYLVSNEKSKLIDFTKKNSKVVLKLLNQDFYKIDDGKFMGFYVNVINETDFEKFSETEENPVFLQKYIEKKYEVRYTVVGDEHFVCKIDSQKSDISKIDWRRYDLANTPHSILSPPDNIKKMVSCLMKELKLIYGALDFIVSDKNEWYFLEINPSGQYLWIEDLTGLKITNSIKNYLLDLQKNK